jgi:2-oxoglutarate ferredoxin oxidoreductase subunit alpha
MNLGQLALLLRARYLVDVVSYNRVRGMPFSAKELVGAITELAGSLDTDEATTPEPSHNGNGHRRFGVREEPTR